MESKKVLIQTSGGAVRGEQTQAGYRFLGVPYAFAERFGRPHPAAWERLEDGALDGRVRQGVYDATSYGPVCPQYSFPLSDKPATVDHYAMGSEQLGLNLNVWTPELNPERDAGKAAMPVCFYVHGGAYQFGSNSAPAEAGDRFMGRDRMVFVSVNYRLGLLGFLELRHLLGDEYRSSGISGALDVVAALRWVHENIDLFGGDASQITVLGISAGAKQLGALLTAPAANTLFARALLESGATQALRTRTTAAKLTDRFLTFSGITARELLDLPLERMIALQAAFCEQPGSTCFFGPVMDGELFPENWPECAASIAGFTGQLMLGSCRNEMAMAVDAPTFDKTRAELLNNLFGVQEANVRESCERLRAKGMPEREAWVTVISDYMYRSHTDRLAARMAAAGNAVYNYSFEFPPAFHSEGFAFLMHEARDCYPLETILGGRVDLIEQAERLSLKMWDAARAFVRTGNPNTEEVNDWQPLSQVPDGKECFGLNGTAESRLLRLPEDSLPEVCEYAFVL